MCDFSIKKYRLDYISLLIVMVMTLCACHTQKKAAYYPTKRGYNVQVPDEWRSLDIALAPGDNKRLYQEIKGWLGTPYKYGGNSKSGVDCSGFVVQIYKVVYHKQIERNSAMIYEKNCRLIDVDDLQEGDLLFYCTAKNTKRISHVGIYLKDNKFAHASATNGVKISDITEDYFIDHFYAAARVENWHSFNDK